VALEQLVKNEPGFILGYVELANLLQENGRNEDAIAVLDQGATIHPYSSEIVMAQVLALSDAGQHIEASIAAREFAVLNLDHPQAGEFEDLAEEELNTFLNGVRNANISGGALTILTNIFIGGQNPWDSWDNAIATYEIIELALSDEKDFGSRAAEQYKQQLPLLEDPEVVDYVTQLGLQVAQPMGRDFDYEFFVVQDNSLNAFALPGGKIFVNTGTILSTDSQAELAGVLAHEAAHSVLSHGMQKMFSNNIFSQLQSEIPFGEFITTMVSLNYSRDQERQSDILGTRVLSTSGYAADGLRNFMVTLAQNTPAGSPVDEYFSTHPASPARVSYLEELIQRNGYNRYALEGVDKHREIQAKLAS
jgi:predicted Zn-dependent protease